MFDRGILNNVDNSETFIDSLANDMFFSSSISSLLDSSFSMNFFV